MRLALTRKERLGWQQGPRTQIRHCPEPNKDKDRGKGGQGYLTPHWQARRRPIRVSRYV